MNRFYVEEWDRFATWLVFDCNVTGRKKTLGEIPEDKKWPWIKRRYHEYRVGYLK